MALLIYAWKGSTNFPLELNWASLREHLTINILCWKYNLVPGFKRLRSAQLTSGKEDLLIGDPWTGMGTYINRVPSTTEGTPGTGHSFSLLYFSWCLSPGVKTWCLPLILCISIQSLPICFSEYSLLLSIMATWPNFQPQTTLPTKT